MPRTSKSPGAHADARHLPYVPRRPASEEDRLPVHPRKNKVPADKRKRVAMACHECNVRRVKCTGSDPCEQCRVNSRDCSYPRADAKRQVSAIHHGFLEYTTDRFYYLTSRPNKQTKPASTRDGPDPELVYLEMEEWERMHEAADPNHASHAEAFSQEDTSSDPDWKVLDARMLIDSAGTARIFGRSSGACFLDGVKEVMGVSGPLATALGQRFESGGYGADFLQSLGYYQTYDSRPFQLPPPRPYAVPSSPEIGRLFDLTRMFLSDGNGTYRSGGSMFWNFPRLDCIAAIAEIGRRRPNTLPPPIFFRSQYALAHALMAFGRLLDATGPESRVEGNDRMGEGHLAAVRCLIGDSLDGHAYTKEAIPIMALMALYMVENNRRDQAAIIVGTALNIAIGQGMNHGNCADEGDLRTFWTLYVLDRWLACVLGRPVKLPEDDVSLALPGHVDGYPSPDGLLAHIRLARLSQRITYDNYLPGKESPKGKDAAIARVNDDLAYLKQWTNLLPASLILAADPLDMIPLPQTNILNLSAEEVQQRERVALEMFPDDRGCVSLHMGYNQLIIIAVRPAYLRAVQRAIASIADLNCIYELEEDPQARSIKICTEAAQRNLRLGWLIRHRSPGNRLLVPDLHHIFNAALILIMHQIVSSNYRSSISDEIHWARSVFEEEASMGSPFAKDCYAVLKDFHHLATTLHSTIHSQRGKQYLWEERGDRLQRALNLRLPEHTFSIPANPLFANDSQKDGVDRSKVYTIHHLFTQWQNEAQYFVYSRPLS